MKKALLLLSIFTSSICFGDERFNSLEKQNFENVIELIETVDYMEDDILKMIANQREIKEMLKQIMNRLDEDKAEFFSN